MVARTRQRAVPCNGEKKAKVIPVGAHKDNYSEKCYADTSAKLHNDFASMFIDIAFAHNMMCAEYGIIASIARARPKGRTSSKNTFGFGAGIWEAQHERDHTFH